MTDRRHVLKSMAGGLLGLALPSFGTARRSGITRLNDTLGLVTGVGSNVLALATPDGLVLVDSGAAQFTDQLMAQLREMPGSGRVRTLFNTHWHLDHTGSNEELGGAGAKIIAHANTRRWMATEYYVPAEERYEKARPAVARPTEIFYSNGTMNAGGERIAYGYLLEAHTSGDSYIFFRDSNVLAVGDVVSPERDPELDYFTGAWIGARVDAMDLLLKLSDDQTRIVPGYGRVIDRAGLKAERDLMAKVCDRTIEQARKGYSPQDMLNAGILDGLGRTWHDPLRFVYALHKGAWAHHNKLSGDVL